MMIGSLYDTLPDLISSVGETHFYDQVEKCFQRVPPISSFKILSYPRADKPEILCSKEESELDKLYCESAYLLDPFYDVICRKHQNELVTLDSITRNDFESSTYYDQFYHRVGWSNETNFIVSVDNGRTICLVYTSEQAPLHQLNSQLIPYLKSIEAAIRKHEELNSQIVETLPATSDAAIQVSHSFELDQRLEMFGLTKREKEIVGYILQGHPSPAIAERCFVSEGTIKNHRKNIYRKLNIKSQCELFAKFLN